MSHVPVTDSFPTTNSECFIPDSFSIRRKLYTTFSHESDCDNLTNMENAVVTSPGEGLSMHLVLSPESVSVSLCVCVCAPKDWTHDLI